MKKITTITNILLAILFGITTISNAQWLQIGQDIDGEAAGDYSGRAVSISSDGSVVAIGASGNDGNGSNAGQVRVYENISGIWIQIGQDIDGETAYDQSGYSVSLSYDGNVVAIGAVHNGGNGINAGHVRVFQNISGGWTQIGADIDGEEVADKSGISVSLNSDGFIVAIGAEGNDGSAVGAGHVRIYQYISNAWTQIGEDIDGEDAYDNSGQAVSLNIDGTIVAIGAQMNDVNGLNTGHVRVYQNISGTWTQIGEDIDGEAVQDHFGRSVSLSDDGSIVAIGASLNNGNGYHAGHVRIYQNVSGTWTQIGEDIDGEVQDYLGWSVSLNSDGSIVAIGASNDVGRVRVYQNISGTWVKIGDDINGEAALDNFGYSVGLSSDGFVVAIGAWKNNDNGANAGHVRVYNNLTIGTAELLNTMNVSIYPNPTSNYLTIESEQLIINKINIIDIAGKTVNMVTTGFNKVDVSVLPSGIYFIKLIGEEETITRKFIKK